MRIATSLFILLFLSNQVSSMTLHVGAGYPYNSLEEAAAVSIPGDTILIHEGVYQGGVFIADLQGTSSSLIYILAAEGEDVIFSGGTNAWQFTDASYLYIAGFTFQDQTGNGLNFDDGGSYETPAHHVIFENCTFRNINANGNNDLLKLSGLDDFEISHCIFLNGAAGGSGIDMVGCHNGIIQNNRFENLGSNSIQAKGGTSNIEITRNLFKNGGARAVNLGGSTGLPFFRPIDAPYESAELKVYSNIFIGSEAPVAFVGTINTEVVNNTIYLPTKWVLRILQETVDPDRFPPCGNNTFRNNIIYLDERCSIECNIGPNTAPETFTFSNNLWYHVDNANWPGPNLPVPDPDNIVGQDPLFVNGDQDDFHLEIGSTAIGSGYSVNYPEFDYEELPFLTPRSIGAQEGGIVSGIHESKNTSLSKIKVWPNPAKDFLQVVLLDLKLKNATLTLQSITGQIIFQKSYHNINDDSTFKIEIESIPNGLYFLIIEEGGCRRIEEVVILK